MGKTAFGACLSKELRGKHPRSVGARRELLRKANKACAGKRR